MIAGVRNGWMIIRKTYKLFRRVAFNYVDEEMIKLIMALFALYCNMCSSNMKRMT